MPNQRSVETSNLEASPFLKRHIGPSPSEQRKMLKQLGQQDLDGFISKVIPAEILDAKPSTDLLSEGCSEIDALKELREIAKANKPFRSLIGLGYHGTATPPLIQRQILENPSWYTAYTPYQAEISQGRLEALFNFQTLISELTGLPIANASLLDEGTAAAEAMNLSYSVCKQTSAKRFLVDIQILPQTLAVLKTRAEPLGIQLEINEPDKFDFNKEVFGVLLQLPGSKGRLWDPSSIVEKAHSVNSLVTVAIDPLSQVLLAPIGHLGVDIAVGSTQRFGIPIGFGGPHAAFFATRENFKRQVPGRLVGQSVDSEGKPALRLALQTREQHIRRDKATSNICTAQVLLAVMAGFYAIHHGPEGLEKIAYRILLLRKKLEQGLHDLNYKINQETRFDTIEVICEEAPNIHHLAHIAGFNLRVLPLGSNEENAKGFGITLDELSNEKELNQLLKIFSEAKGQPLKIQEISELTLEQLLPKLPLRNRPWLQQKIFHLYRSETELMRYMQKLVNKDFSLVHGMIPLGSCTMKLNAAAELAPISWKEFSSLHPFSPNNQSKGYQKIIKDLERWLSTLTGFAGVSLQPNSGSQGEFAGLLVIQAWHKSRGESFRDVCLIPTSAHGTNPASSVMAGLRVIPISCDKEGNIDLKDLEEKAKLHSSKLAALMVTYPSTHGVFEPKINEICETIHHYGGQIYLDGANLNAQVGLCRPGNYGADVCHLNLHKTFCIPHGGGGPGIGPIAVAKHLIPFLPGHPLIKCGGIQAVSPVSSAPFGSASILPISWMYLRMMGAKGLRQASSIALLSANYIAEQLNPYFPVLFKGPTGLVAHECILDLSELKRSTGVEVDDVAKRLMDYGFHAPTVSWPVSGSLMVEPTESESLNELNRFCQAMISIHKEADAIKNKEFDPKNNPLKRSPHTLKAISSDIWDRPYTREQAAFPQPCLEDNKFWPAVSRVDNAYGDRNLVCSCRSVEDLADQG